MNSPSVTGDYKFKIARVSDYDIAEKIEQFLEIPFETAGISQPRSVRKIDITFQFYSDALSGTKEEMFGVEGLKAKTNQYGRSITDVNVFYEDGVTLNVNRPGDNSPGFSLFDSVTVNARGLKPIDALDLVKKASDHFRPVILPPQSPGPEGTVDSIIAAHLGMIGSLEASHANFTAELARHAIRVEEGLRRRTEELEESFRSKSLSLEQDYAAKADSLAKREADLDAKDNRHARRAVQQTLEAKMKTRAASITLTPETKRARVWPIVTTVVMLSLFVMGAIYFGFVERSAAETTSWFVIARQLAFTTAAGVTGTCLIQMQQRWFRRHADSEFRLKKLQLDQDRANWLVELAQEWKDAKGGEMPEALVERLSRNLFVEEGEHESDLHPLETLASAVLGQAGKVSLKMPGGEATWDRSDLKRMKSEERE